MNTARFVSLHIDACFVVPDIITSLHESDEPFSPGFAAASDYVRSWRSSQRLPLLRADIQAAVDSIASFTAPFKQVGYIWVARALL